MIRPESGPRRSALGPSIDQVRLSGELNLARDQLVDAKEGLARVMADVRTLPTQLKTNVVQIIEGAADRVRRAEAHVDEAAALCSQAEVEQAAISQREKLAPSPSPLPRRRPGEYRGMLAFGLMCLAAAALHLLVGW